MSLAKNMMTTLNRGGVVLSVFCEPDLKEQLSRIRDVKTVQCNIALPIGNLKVSKRSNHVDIKMS